MDFPFARFHSPVITSISPEAVGIPAAVGAALTAASVAWPAANRAIFVPFVISSPYLVRKVWWMNGSGAVSGNVDVGIYTMGGPDGASGQRIAAAGTTAQATASVIQSVTLGTPILLAPGAYYMAMEASTSTQTFMRFAAAIANLTAAGCALQAVGSMPLPATTTLATSSTYLPVFGICSGSVI